jgi:hypothetical protein
MVPAVRRVIFSPDVGHKPNGDVLPDPDLNLLSGPETSTIA